LHALEPPSSADDAEISPTVLGPGTEEAGPQGPQSGGHGRRRRDETTKSDLGVSSDRATDRLGLRYSHQQGCGAAHSRRSVPAGPRLRGAVLAHGPRSREGQSVEARSVSMRICRPADTLGARRDGPMHASDRGFGVHRGAVDGVGLCLMFNRATRGHTPPTYLSSDHDPLYRFHQWQANLRTLDVKEIAGT